MRDEKTSPRHEYDVAELVAERDAARADLETARRERDEAIALLAGADSPEAAADALTDRLRALRSALDEVL